MVVQGKTHGWIKNFLSDRRQKVILEGECSDTVSVTSGVPQGTVLGPILFLMYINDIAERVNFCTLRLFADDCVLEMNITSEDDCEAPTEYKCSCSLGE